MTSLCADVKNGSLLRQQILTRMVRQGDDRTQAAQRDRSSLGWPLPYNSDA